MTVLTKNQLPTAVPHRASTLARGALKWLAWAVAGVVALGGFLAFRTYREHAALAEQEKAAEASRAPQAIAVTVAPVTPRAIQRRIHTVGTLHGYEEIEVAAKVGGRVARVSVDIGDIVHPGDELLAIDDTDLKLAVAEGERALEMELARFALKEPPGEDFDDSDTPGVARALLIEKNAKRRLARTEALAQDRTLSRGAIAEQELEQAQTDYEVAIANTRQAKLEAAQTLASIRWRESALAVARQALADAAIVAPRLTRSSDKKQNADIALTSHGESDDSATTEYAELEYGEFEYAVAERRVSEGEMLSTMPPTTLFRLVVDRPLKLKAAIPEMHMAEVRIGQRVELLVEAYPNEPFPGRIVRINPTINVENRTFEIEVQTLNSDRRLRPGAFAKVAILVDEDNSALTVPEEAVIQFAGVVKVFVVKDGKSISAPIVLGSREEVKVGKQTKIWIEATSPSDALKPGMEVVTSGHSQLADGTAVRIREPLK
jgi:multidrug efflux pump subunit AcrA (membrane-fusion protein)